jgi:hypothetical protein
MTQHIPIDWLARLGIILLALSLYYFWRVWRDLRLINRRPQGNFEKAIDEALTALEWNFNFSIALVKSVFEDDEAKK